VSYVTISYLLLFLNTCKKFPHSFEYSFSSCFYIAYAEILVNSWILLHTTLTLIFQWILPLGIVLYLYIYIAHLAVHNNQKRFHLHASAAHMQWYYRTIVCEEFGQGPYTVIVSDEARTLTLRFNHRAAYYPESPMNSATWSASDCLQWLSDCNELYPHIL